MNRYDQVPDFYISFDSQEAIEYFNIFKISHFLKFLQLSKKNHETYLPLFVLEF